jgi:hypothetical protein
MSQADKQDLEKGNVMGMYSATLALPYSNSLVLTDVVDEQNDQGPPAPTQPGERVKAGDSSDPLFTMYSKFAEDEDKKMTDRWKKDADGIIIFVCLVSAVCTVPTSSKEITKPALDTKI